MEFRTVIQDTHISFRCTCRIGVLARSCFLREQRKCSIDRGIAIGDGEL